MIELQHLTKDYLTSKGPRRVLNDINLTIKPGRNVGILGRNGSGKSTLLRLIGGAEQPTAGRVCTTGSVSWPIGFSGGFAGSLTGRENMRFICRIYNKPIDDVVDFVEDFAQLGDYMNMPIASYSSGMKAKLAFGLSMAIDFDYYLIDEVTAVGDATFKKRSKAEFDKRKDRSTLLVVSHQIKTIREHCEIAAVLHNGQLKVFEDLDEAIDLYDNLPARGH